MKKRSLLCILLGLSIWSACRPEPDTAHWEVDTLLPLAKTRLDIQDLNPEDSLLSARSDGLLSLVLRQELAKIKPGEVAPPFNENFSNTANLEQITLGKQVVQNRISLGMVASQAGLNGALLIAANGTNQVIPPLNNIGPSNFNIDATQFFQSITLKDGWLVLRMENNFPIDLTNLQYAIENQLSGTIILQNTLPLLPVGGVHYDSVHLVNNFLIEGNLVASLINMDSPGSNGNAVLIDTSDALDLQVTIDKMDPVSATAVFPAQDLFNDTATASIFPPSALLTSVHVDSGDIFMDAYSTIDDSINLRYILPGALDPQGTILNIDELIPAAQPNSTVNRYLEVPISNYLLDLTGLPSDIGVFNTFYTIFIGGIDSTGRIINLSLSDSVYVNTGIRNLVTDRAYGFMGYDTLISNESLSTDTFPDILGGTIDLKEAQVSLSIENYIGAEFTARINDLKVSRANLQRSLSWNQLGFEFAVPAAQEIQPGSKPDPGRTQINLDNNNSNIQDLIEIRPALFETDVTAFMNKGQAPTNLNQFLYTDYGLEAYVDINIPLHAALEDLVMGDTVDFYYYDLDPEERLKSISLKVLADNAYPFTAEAELILFDPNRIPLDTLTSADLIDAAPRDQDGRSAGLSSSELSYPLTKAQLEVLKQCRYIFIRSLFNSPNQEAVKIYSVNYLDLQLVGDLRLSTE